MAAKPICWLILMFFLSIISTNAEEYYVAQNGKDSNKGSQASPWRTLQKAAGVADRGDVVYIKEGIYLETVTVENSGCSDNYITFKAYPGHEVILDGSRNAGWHGVFSIYGKDYIKLQDIEIRNNHIGWGVLIEHEQGNVKNSASQIEINGVEVHHTGGEAIQIRGNASNILIENCRVHHSKKHSGIDIYQWDNGRPRDVTVRKCVAYNYPNFAGIASEQADNLIIEGNLIYNSEIGIDVGSGSKNIIRDNAVYDCADGIALSSNEKTKIYNNTVHDIYNEAIYAYYWSAHGEAHFGNEWYNNVIYNVGFGIYESNQKGSKGTVGPTSEHEYYNNLFYNVGAHGAYRVPFYFKGVTGIKFYNNTIYMNAGYDALAFIDGAVRADIRNNIISLGGNRVPIMVDNTSKPGSMIDYNCYHNRSGRVEGLGDHSITSAPGFKNPGDGRFELNATSPCIDAGTSEGAFPMTDLTGYSRCDDNNRPNLGNGPWPHIDIGAYEYRCQ